MSFDTMHLRILLPYGIFDEQPNVQRLVVETANGAYGFLPNRLDCVANLVPGILTYETAEKGEVYTAIDIGVMIKTGQDVVVSVRNALSGADLGALQSTVERKFRVLDEREKDVRSVLAKLESGFMRQLQKIREE